MKRGQSTIDTSSFGAPREAFDCVVGPNKFNYKPFKDDTPGPAQYYGGKDPFREIGSVLANKFKYSMGHRNKKECKCEEILSYSV